MVRNPLRYVGFRDGHQHHPMGSAAPPQRPGFEPPGLVRPDHAGRRSEALHAPSSMGSQTRPYGISCKTLLRVNHWIRKCLPLTLPSLELARPIPTATGSQRQPVGLSATDSCHPATPSSHQAKASSLPASSSVPANGGRSPTGSIRAEQGAA